MANMGWAVRRGTHLPEKDDELFVLADDGCLDLSGVFSSGACTLKESHTFHMCIIQSYMFNGMNDGSSFQIDAHETAQLHD